MEDGRDLDELTELSDELRGYLNEKKKQKTKKTRKKEPKDKKQNGYFLSSFYPPQKPKYLCKA